VLLGSANMQCLQPEVAHRWPDRSSPCTRSPPPPHPHAGVDSVCCVYKVGHLDLPQHRWADAALACSSPCPAAVARQSWPQPSATRQPQGYCKSRTMVVPSSRVAAQVQGGGQREREPHERLLPAGRPLLPRGGGGLRQGGQEVRCRCRRRRSRAMVGAPVPLHRQEKVPPGTAAGVHSSGSSAR
jgi:hypothetical protein